MTLRDTINLLESIAAAQPAVNMIVRDNIDKLNACPNAKYGAFAWTQGIHSGSMDSWGVGFSFSLFYVDRLTESGDNMIEVQSAAVSLLDTVIRATVEAGLEAADGWTITTFSLKFADMCAGAWATVVLRAPYDTICVETFDVPESISII